ncbi:MAG: efflux RND transporter periplasmic adaptor subunit [Bacteroidia bacterium]|nr:efflux RND transporter periplasmic adaptor subunit [Bacteroidia bacterium]MCZ2248818.1 HlyD family secretion protein [Bacteroidia bacterium]
MLKNKWLIGIGGLLLIILIYYVFIGKSNNDADVYTEVKQGDFEINVFTTGELEAKNSVDIQGPSSVRQLGLWQIKISDLIPEGTNVKEGDYVASLDKTEISNKIKEAESELDKIQSQYTQTKLDTTLQLRQSRDDLVNMSFDMQQKEIILEQSAYEPPATIRQAQLDLEKSKRTYNQAVKNYSIKEKQLAAKMQEVSASLSLTSNKLQLLNNTLKEFTVVAPKDGMVIYQREWSGKKKGVGSTISPWESTVATLPDLTTMISKTYVNEVDIRKIKLNQKVNISIDAYPEKKLTGIVTSVANVGEQNPKSDAKVFEVTIQVNEKDTSLRPSMTTGNKILVGKVNQVLIIPLESIHNSGDTLSYVYVKEGMSIAKREIIVGQTNENNAIVKEGLNKGEIIYLSLPKEAESMSVQRLSKKK